MDTTKAVIVLAVLVAAAFIIYPKLNGSGKGTTFSIAPATELMEIPSDVACQTAEECIAYAKTNGAEGTVQAKCETAKCVFLVPKMALAEVTP